MYNKSSVFVVLYYIPVQSACTCSIIMLVLCEPVMDSSSDVMINSSSDDVNVMAWHAPDYFEMRVIRLFRDVVPGAVIDRFIILPSISTFYLIPPSNER